MKEAYHNRQIRFSVLSRGEPSFLDLQEVGGVDGRGMVLVASSPGPFPAFQSRGGHPHRHRVQSCDRGQDAIKRSRHFLPGVGQTVKECAGVASSPGPPIFSTHMREKRGSLGSNVTCVT